MLVVGALRFTSKLAGTLGLDALDACAGAGAGAGANDTLEPIGAPPGTGLPRRFPEPAKGPGGGGT
jgi:hypothetical protein